MNISKSSLAFVPCEGFTNQNPDGKPQLFGIITTGPEGSAIFEIVATANWNAGELRKIADRMVASTAMLAALKDAAAWVEMTGIADSDPPAYRAMLAAIANAEGRGNG